MKVVLLNYADNSFKVRQKLSIAAAKRFSIRNIISYSDMQIKNTEFYTANRKILDQKRGSGYWLWKPFIIYEELKKMKEGDVLIYLDSGVKFISDPAPIVELCKTSTSGIVVFDMNPIPNSQFTKRDAFINLNCDEKKYWNSFQIMGNFMLLRKCDSALQFVKEWLDACENEDTLTDTPNKKGLPDLPGYIDHRHDQSVLSLLVKKYGLETYRNPTYHGNFLKTEKFRVKGEKINYPYFLQNTITSYSDRPQQNSPYGTIIQTFPKDYERLAARLKHYIKKIKNKL